LMAFIDGRDRRFFAFSLRFGITETPSAIYAAPLFEIRCLIAIMTASCWLRAAVCAPASPLLGRPRPASVD